MTKKRVKKNHKKSKSGFPVSVMKLLDLKSKKQYGKKKDVQRLGANEKVSVEDRPLKKEHTVASPKNQYLKSNRTTKVGILKKQYEGRVDHVNQRYAYIVVTGREDDIYVKTSNLKTAIHNDTVVVALLSRQRGSRTEGKVHRIIKRSRHQFVGCLSVTAQGGFVRPDIKKIHEDFFIPKGTINNAKTNDIVLIEITAWGSSRQVGEGRVLNVLGARGENNAEMHAIMAEFDLPFHFPEAVLKEAEKMQHDISKKEIEKRKDFRKTLTFTIDPEDAKDFDDALSFKKCANGRYEIGIHIADASHYVKPESLTDQEAYRRATSVYLVDRTIPMLPERLSNDLCSLRPNEDKLTFSVVMEMDDQGIVHNTWYGKTIIHSDRRFTYEEAQHLLEKPSEEAYVDVLKTLNTIAKNLRKERFEKGSLNFETLEIKFELDEHAKPIRAIIKERKDAHKLIEEFMLVANRTVASHIHGLKTSGKKNVFVYRAHDSPDQEKMKNFKDFAKRFGYVISTHKEEVAKSLNALMEKIQGTPEQNILGQLAIRAMAKAHYTTKATSHFGLAFEHYTHFTSPIRRYPDIMAHRMLQGYLENTKSDSPQAHETLCLHCSEKERQVVSAERSSIKYKQVELMSTAEDKVYEGVISGVTDFGIFVELTETRCEGMIRLKDLRDDFYQLDEKNYRVIGKRKKKIYQFGDPIHVRIAGTNLDKRMINLTLCDSKK